MTRILAIDDNPDNLVTVTALIGLFIPDSEVVTALSGEQGIEMAESRDPDTILLDIHMPGMDGFEVCRRLKSSETTCHIPIIMLTALRTESKSRVKALDMGADAFLTKPINESELAAQVKAMLRIKKAEDKLRDEKSHLEALVAHRVNDLSIANEQLVLEIEERERAQKEKKQLEKQLLQSQKLEAIGALAGGIAHDFNNLLYPIIGFSELLKEDLPADNPLFDSVEEIYAAAVRARDLVKQILAFSRQIEQEKSPIKVQMVIKEVVSLSHSVIPSTITIKTDIDPACGPVLADPVKIHQIIMNLLTNAYHAMEKTGGTLTIRLGSLTLEQEMRKGKRLALGDYVCLSVADTGEGIPDRIMDQIFNPYFTTKGVDKGTGLGLSVVHGIITSLDGEIFVESTIGQGTCFEILLPVLKQKKQAGHTPESHPLSRGTGRILLVDDDPQVSNIQSRMLERLGYHVVSENDPQAALARFSKGPEQYDLIMTDLTMPGLTGLELARNISALRPNFPVILCTGFSENMNGAQVREMGVFAMLLKPIVLSELADAVKKAMVAGSAQT